MGKMLVMRKKRLLKSMKIDKEADEKHGSGEGLVQLTAKRG